MLDRSLPYGEVHGDLRGVKYYQKKDNDKGRYYNGEGLEVDFNSPDGRVIETIEPPKAKAKPKPVADDDAPDDDLIVDDVNLSAFMRGESTDSAAKIKKAVEKHFGRKPKDLDEALKIARGEEIE
jgi:hypothetical protein